MSTHRAEIVRYSLTKHPNADTLSIATVKGWQCVVRTAEFPEPEGLGVYIPIDRVTPATPEFAFLAERGYRVKTIKLRGQVSQGLLLPLSIFDKAAGGKSLSGVVEIREGEDVTGILGVERFKVKIPMRQLMRGSSQDRKEPEDGFLKYTGIENWNNWPNVIKPGEDVVITEKIHGANARFAILPDGQFFVGSHFKAKRHSFTLWERLKYWLKRRPLPTLSMWSQVALALQIEKRMRDVLPKGVVLFGEVFGRVQRLQYGNPHGFDFRVFDIAWIKGDLHGIYWPWDATRQAVHEMGLGMVPTLYRGPFHVGLLELRNGPAFRGGHTREGIVIRPAIERRDLKLGRVILKRISEDYLMKGEDEPPAVSAEEVVEEEIKS